MVRAEKALEIVHKSEVHKAVYTMANSLMMDKKPVKTLQSVKDRPNELLEQTHGERLDTRTKGEAIGVISNLETLE